MNVKDWIRVEKQKPHCGESGDWDGKRSDIVLCIDANKEEHLAQCYEGYMDGSYFFFLSGMIKMILDFK